MVMKGPTISLCDVNTYLRRNAFDLYVVNEYTRQLIGKGMNVLEVSKADIKELDSFLASFSGNQPRILAIGAGTVIDAVKYLCFKTGGVFNIIPSALSTNSFATHRNSFFDKERGKVSFDSVVANEIIVDFDLIKQAYILNKFGLVEIASTATAQVDCDIAYQQNKETFSSSLRERARKLVEDTQSIMAENIARKDMLEKLLHLLLESGALTRENGNGRMVSGSEHIISSYIESEKPCPHGMGLLFGIMVASALQDNAGYPNKHVEIIVELLKKDLDIRTYVGTNATATQIINALEKVRPRTDKFTILDIVPREQFLEIGSEVVRNYFDNL
ncbi:MAG: iron-containing alcohol dehydrogenase [Candidatus Zambryskibacteria bacterium]|nr:iron-containing alcohol dehydrogenase [Candidatus Zambryskibacteria bacterium]